MSTPTPDASTSEGRFLTAYGSWQHARMTAGLAMLTAAAAQKLALAANMIHWIVEFDQAWEHLDQDAYTRVRDAHPARGVLSSLRIVYERAGVLSALELAEEGLDNNLCWRQGHELSLGEVDRGLYDQYLGGRSLFEGEEAVMDLLINGEDLAETKGRRVLAQAEAVQWTVGEEAPHEPSAPEDPESQQVIEDAMAEIAMFNTHTPEEIEAYHAERGGYFLTLVVGDEPGGHPLQIEDPLWAWYAIMRQMGSDTTRALTLGGTNPVYMFKGDYAKETVHELAQIARVLNPGHWEVVEGYRTTHEGGGEESRTP